MSRAISFASVGKPGGQLGSLDDATQVPLPPPYDKFEEPPLPRISDQVRATCECSLDDTVALSLPRPANAEEEAKLVKAFLSGLEKNRTTGPSCSRSCSR